MKLAASSIWFKRRRDPVAQGWHHNRDDISRWTVPNVLVVLAMPLHVALQKDVADHDRVGAATVIVNYDCERSTAVGDTSASGVKPCVGIGQRVVNVGDA